MRAYLLIGILIIFAISECHLKSVAEESSLENQGDPLEEAILSKNKNEEHGRNKRAIALAAATGFGVLTGILSIVGFGLGMHGDNKRDKEIADIKDKLQQLDGKLEGLADDVDALKMLVSAGQERLEAGQRRLEAGQGRLEAGQRRLSATCLYGKDISRLRYFLSQLNKFLTLQNDSSLGPAGLANQWADSVLDMGVDGVGQVLHNFHEMVMGRKPLFGHKPIFALLEKGMDRDSENYWRHIKEIEVFLYTIQVSGYAVWFTALNVKGRHSEVANIQSIAMDRLTDQAATIEPMLLEWPNGTYGLPMTDTGCPLAAGVQWQNGTRHQHTDCCGTRAVSGIHFPTGSVHSRSMKQHFCMKTGTGGRGSWPKGNYCLFMKGDTCPSGFSQGFMRWDDQNTNNANRASGSLPDGKYDENTLIFFCCRSDGPSSTPIDLPNRKPFYLLKYQSDSQCQEVRGMKVKGEYFQWDTENDREVNILYGAHPYSLSIYDIRIYYCYYHS